MLYENKKNTNLRTNEVIQRFTLTQYANDPEEWDQDGLILGKPTNTRIYDGNPDHGGATLLRESRMQYHADRPWLLAESIAVHRSDGVEYEHITHYNYDGHGNLIWESNPRNSEWGSTTSWSGDIDIRDGMFPTQVTNALDHTIQREYHSGFGVVTKEIGVNGQETIYTYDSFGRKRSVTFEADGSQQTFDYNIEPGNHWVSESATGQPLVTTYTDNLGRETLKVVDDGVRPICTKTEYDGAGRVWRKSLPAVCSGQAADHYAGTDYEYIENTYDGRGRVIVRSRPDGEVRRVDFVGFRETHTNEKGQVKEYLKDSMARLSQVTEPTGGVTTYRYDEFDNLIGVTGPLGNETSIEYDDLGRKIAMNDPYMGHWEYGYDEAGNLIWQVDAENRRVEMDYDEINRLESKSYLASGRSITYQYDQARSGSFNTGALTTLTATEPPIDPEATYNTFIENMVEYNYDAMGRNESEVRTINDTAFVTYREYDLAGRLELLTYPNGTQIEYAYHPMGYLRQVDQIDSDGQRSSIAEYGGHNVMGQQGYAQYGNGARTDYTYKPETYLLDTVQTTAFNSQNQWGLVQNISYAFDELGNPIAITDHVNGADYSYVYDDLNRLETADAVCPSAPIREYSQAYYYDLAGNMERKTGRGGFEITWQNPGHIRPLSVRFDETVDGVGQRQVDYNQDNKPSEITYNGQKSELYYDGHGNRVKKLTANQTILYVGKHYEVRGSQTILHIFAAGKRIASIRGEEKTYTHSDHLGSTSIVTNDTAMMIEEIGYLPFGATLFRNTYNNGTWSSDYRYTGQEFDSESGLYNYNARLYDPVLCRFITPDTVMPNWTNPQSLNRYAYVMNNPLKYTDPSGHSFILFSIIAGAAMGAANAYANGGKIWEGAFIGGVLAAFSAGVFTAAGDIIASHAITSCIGGKAVVVKSLTAIQQAGIHLVAGSITGAINSGITGGNPLRGALIGGLSAGIGKYTRWDNLGGRMMLGAVIGGVSSEMAGGDFTEGAFWGAWSSAMAYVFNDCYHRCLDPNSETCSDFFEREADCTLDMLDDLKVDKSELSDIGDGTIGVVKTLPVDLAIEHGLSKIPTHGPTIAKVFSRINLAISVFLKILGPVDFDYTADYPPWKDDPHDLP